ncbi:hypothetical protein AVEN_210669-1 [Araneus ventricosus]|uniref:Uncharacterized protein n=1 Tax=Araneus ventricosus TaxID=182803 RepID=A0A4Y2U1F8_ARAVE|nr:hypothetical protein AVEN_210669-1 [Araneus ventricosus]
MAVNLTLHLKLNLPPCIESCRKFTVEKVLRMSWVLFSEVDDSAWRQGYKSVALSGGIIDAVMEENCRSMSRNLPGAEWWQWNTEAFAENAIRNRRAEARSIEIIKLH